MTNYEPTKRDQRSSPDSPAGLKVGLEFLARFTEAKSFPAPSTTDSPLPKPVPNHWSKQWIANCSALSGCEKSSVKYPAAPPRGSYGAVLTDSTSALYAYINAFISCLRPNPIEIKPLKEYVDGQLTTYHLALKLLEGETGFILCLTVGLMLCLLPTIIALSSLCLTTDPPRYRHWAQHCKKTSIVISLDAIFILLLVGVSGVLVTNESVRAGVSGAGTAANLAAADLATFAGDTQRHLVHVLTSSFDAVIASVNEHLEGVENVLGQPIQAEIVKETGLNVALDSLLEMTAGVESACAATEALVREAAELEAEANGTRERVGELRSQVEATVRHCSAPDRPLCDTLPTHSLDVRLTVTPFINNMFLAQFRPEMAENLSGAAMEATTIFTSLPHKIETDTRASRKGVMDQLYVERSRLREATHKFEEFTTKAKETVRQKISSLDPYIAEAKEWDYYRWIIGVVSGLLVLIIWLFLFITLCFECCAANKATIPMIILMVSGVCVISAGLWAVVVVCLMAGGHAQSVACSVLHEGGDYPLLSQLADTGHRTFLGTLLHPAGRIELPLGTVLRECEEGGGTYMSLGLPSVYNLSGEAGAGRWQDLRQRMTDISVSLRDFQVLTPTLQYRLNDLLDDLSLNITNIRVQLSGAVVAIELNSFGDQLENVASQVSDLNTANHLQTLASRSRRLLSSHVLHLQHSKESLIYHLTALELKLVPLMRQVNQSLSHLRTIQYFIKNQGNLIAQQYVERYTKKMMQLVEEYGGYLDGRASSHNSNLILDDLGSCKPLWKVYQYARTYVCTEIVDPLNGFWFCLGWCLFLFLFLTPLSLKLMELNRVDCDGSFSRSQSEESFDRDETPVWSTTGHHDITPNW